MTAARIRVDPTALDLFRHLKARFGPHGDDVDPALVEWLLPRGIDWQHDPEVYAPDGRWHRLAQDLDEAADALTTRRQADGTVAADAYRDAAARIRAALDEQPAATGPVERQWAVIWPEEDGLTPDDLVEVCDDETHARDVAALYQARGVVLASRTVTYGEWEDQP